MMNIYFLYDEFLPPIKLHYFHLIHIIVFIMLCTFFHLIYKRIFNIITHNLYLF